MFTSTLHFESGEGTGQPWSVTAKPLTSLIPMSDILSDPESRLRLLLMLSLLHKRTLFIHYLALSAMRYLLSWLSFRLNDDLGDLESLGQLVGVLLIHQHLHPLVFLVPCESRRRHLGTLFRRDLLKILCAIVQGPWWHFRHVTRVKVFGSQQAQSGFSFFRLTRYERCCYDHTFLTSHFSQSLRSEIVRRTWHTRVRAHARTHIFGTDPEAAAKKLVTS